MEPGLPITLLDILSNILVFSQTAPYLPISALLSLSTTSKAFRALVYNSPDAFKRFDLSTVKGPDTDFLPIDRGGEIWRSERMDEAITEEDFYAGPLRGIFSTLKKRNVLSDVQTLILDGQSVPADILREIICEEQYHVRLLSILNVRNLNDSRFQKVIRYAIRPGRPQGTPRVKGIYYFGTQTTSKAIATGIDPRVSMARGVAPSTSAPFEMALNHQVPPSSIEDYNTWYKSSGEILNQCAEWALLLQACRSIIAWDAVVCRGPKHQVPSKDGTIIPLLPYIAAVALGPRGCEICHSAPEGPGISPDELPMLVPLPFHTSSVKVAQQIPSCSGSKKDMLFFARCQWCLSRRYCGLCGKWWCEDCYQMDESNTSTQNHGKESESAGIKRDCFECGHLCRECNTRSQRLCKCCGGGFCLLHNEGSTADKCDWCQLANSRRTRELY